MKLCKIEIHFSMSINFEKTLFCLEQDSSQSVLMLNIGNFISLRLNSCHTLNIFEHNKLGAYKQLYLYAQIDRFAEILTYMYL